MPTTTLDLLKPLHKQSQEISLSIKGLSFSYNDTPILEDVNLTVSKGEFVVIFGPNGGGKTTLFKLLMGFVKPHSGEISIFKKPPELMRRQIGYVPQKVPFDALFPITTLDVVLQGALSHTTWWGHLPRIWKERARTLLRQMGLSAHEKKRFGELSGGLTQRALLARALLSQPSLLLLDEPTANVDPQAELDILDLLLKLKGKTTILLITHNLQSVTPLADRLICIHRTATPYLPDEVCNHFSAGLYPENRETD